MVRGLMKKLIIGICALGGLLSCSPPGDPELTCDPSPAAATLGTNMQAVFEAKCATCHEAGYSYGDYTSAAKTGEIVNKKSLYAGMQGTLQVVDGKNKSLANSSLWLKILGGAMSGRQGPKGENVYGRMPNDTTMLTADEKKLFKDWICNGAQ
jgi:hypothetical protein